MKTLGLSALLTLLLYYPFANAGTETSNHPAFIYEIFTQSFQSSRRDGTGDLEGVRQKLDYISSLGADAIWLTPIFDSPSYHGYDVSNYEHIKSIYGDLSDFKNLVSDAHSRGIKILLDVPVNHTSNEHPWFSEPDLYLWSPTPLWNPSQWFPLNGQYYFSSFSPSMPDLNWKNPEVLSRIESTFHYWTSLGVDGFRLDAAKFLVKGPNGEQNTSGTHEVWKKITAFIKKVAPNTYFVGEVWDSAETIASYYGNGDELDAAFDFPVEGAIRSSLSSMKNTDLVNALNEQLVKQHSPFFAAPFAGNHDLERLATSVGSDLAKQKLAALTVFALPGTPVVYYGDEIGTEQGDDDEFPGDLAKRTPMNWDEVSAQQSDSESLLNTYRNLAQIRKNHASLNSGTLTGVRAIGSDALSFIRRDAVSDETCLVILNLGDTTLSSATIASLTEGHAIDHAIYGQSDSVAPLRAAMLLLK